MATPRRGLDPERDGVSAWRLVAIGDHAERAYGVRTSAWGMSRLLQRLGLSPQKARPPQGSAAAQAAFKNGLGSRLTAIAAAHPDRGIQHWCEDPLVPRSLSSGQPEAGPGGGPEDKLADRPEGPSVPSLV